MTVLTLKNNAALYFIGKVGQEAITPRAQRLGELRTSTGNAGDVNDQVSEKAFEVDVLNGAVTKLAGNPINREALFDALLESFIEARKSFQQLEKAEALSAHIQELRTLYCSESMQSKIMDREGAKEFDATVRGMTSDFAASSGTEREGARVILAAVSFREMLFTLEHMLRTSSIMAFGLACDGSELIKPADIEGYTTQPAVS